MKKENTLFSLYKWWTKDGLRQKILTENVLPSIIDVKLKPTWVVQRNDSKQTSKSTSELLGKKKFWSGLVGGFIEIQLKCCAMVETYSCSKIL